MTLASVWRTRRRPASRSTCACVGGTLVGVLLLLVTGSGLVAGVGCLVALVLGVAISFVVMGRSIAATARALDVVFPSPE